MEVELLRNILIPAYKIYVYERSPRTDEQREMRKKVLFGKLKAAKKNYRVTADKKYKKEISRIQKQFRYNVSKTEYESCKKLIEDYKASYNDIIDEECWNFEDLFAIYCNAKDRKVTYIEQLDAFD